MLSSVKYLNVLLLLIRIMPGQSSCSCNEMDLDFASGVNLLHYKCNNEISTTPYSIIDPELLLSELNTDIRTIFYIFGYLQFPEDSNVQLMMKALCYGQTDNVVLLDWSKYSFGLYPVVFKDAERVGSLFAESIRKLVNSGLDVSKIYVIGHSLGAHIAGFVGKCNTFKIYRITGLDSANRIFYPPGCYLTSEDAAWVDTIHTDMNGFGTTKTTNADYYANGGTHPQPGCGILPWLPNMIFEFNPIACDHQKSVVYYAKTKYELRKYDAMKCPSYFDYKFGKENCQSITIGIGYTATNVSGSYFFNMYDI